MHREDIHNKINMLKKYDKWLLVTEILCITMLLLYICQNQAVHWDEAYTYRLVTKFSVVDMINETALDIHPPLYYLLLKLCTSIFGTGLIVFKSFSVLCVTATMFLSVVIIKKRWGTGTAVLFNMVCALGPQLVYYAVDVRMYSLQLFFVTCSALLANEIFHLNRIRDWVLFTVMALGGAYTHYFAIVPLAIIYGFLLLWAILYCKTAIKRFVCCCFATVMGYLPWLIVLLKSFKAQGTTGEVNLLSVDIRGLVEWLFSTDIDLSVGMTVVLFFVAVITLILQWKHLKKVDLLFQIMCATNLIISYFICLLIASMSEHFWDNRYIYGALGLFWLFIFIRLLQQKKGTFWGLLVWLLMIVIASFNNQKNIELGTNSYISASHEVLKQVETEKVMLYNFPTYNVVWEFHTPGKEYIYIDDVDLNQIDGNYIYMMAWGGRDFPESVYRDFHIAIDDCGEMRFEEGMAGVRLYRVRFQRR